MHGAIHRHDMSFILMYIPTPFIIIIIIIIITRFFSPHYYTYCIASFLLFSITEMALFDCTCDFVLQS